MRVLVFCAKGFETMEFSVFIDVLGWARNDYGYPIYVDTCGFTKKVTSTFGIPIVVDKTINEINVNDYDALAIPGGFEEFGFYEEAFDIKFQKLIRQFDMQKSQLQQYVLRHLHLEKVELLMEEMRQRII